ncbi:unnamed protein product [Cuscuta campestris]|uniref:Uncharacterized protein n=1 Tax=Cuscuta campestris TaxID=132261 RepID=A0A484NM03_9ASTE|nr:unnamed protein product [Cuscuta campestris]
MENISSHSSSSSSSATFHPFDLNVPATIPFDLNEVLVVSFDVDESTTLSLLAAASFSDTGVLRDGVPRDATPLMGVHTRHIDDMYMKMKSKSRR